MTRNAFPDGIAVISCRDQTDAELLLRHILSRFTVGRRQPEEVTLATLADRTRQLLTGTHALVVLDNVEQTLPVHEVLQPLRTAGVAVPLHPHGPMPPRSHRPRPTLHTPPLGRDPTVSPPTVHSTR